MANKQNKITVYDIVLIGLMAALCFVGTYLHLDVMTPMGKVMIHFGNVFCLLSGMLLGGVKGGLAAGIGSMFYDILDPAYISECWITFINKFMMAFLCGIIVSYGVKKIAVLQAKAENGELSAKAPTALIKVLSGIGMAVMAVLAVLVGVQGYKVIASFIDGSNEDALSGVIKVIACVLLIAVLIAGIVFGIRMLMNRSLTEEKADAKKQKIEFTTRLLGGIAGILGYLVLYLTKNFIMGILQDQEMTTIYTTLIAKGSVSLINGIIAVVVSLILVPYFVMALKSSGLDRKIMIGKAK